MSTEYLMNNIKAGLFVNSRHIISDDDIKPPLANFRDPVSAGHNFGNLNIVLSRQLLKEEPHDCLCCSFGTHYEDLLFHFFPRNRLFEQLRLSEKEYSILLMNRQALAKKRLPDTPGVYFFLKTRMNADTDADERRLPRRENILYIGRATSLRNRVRSYFAPDIAEKRSQWIAKMLTEAKSVDFRKTDSVLEAILLEADLIKRFKPTYNTDEKDDKSFNYIVITEEDFPSVFIARSNNIDFDTRQLKTSHSKLKTIYGPFTNGFQLQTAMKIIRRIFPYRDVKCIPCNRKAQPYGSKVEPCRPCFNRQIGLCPGVCTGEISKMEYAKTIRNLCLFFEGKKT